MSDGDELVDRVLDSKKGDGFLDVTILRRMSSPDMEYSRLFKVDIDLKKLGIKATKSPLGETTNCEYDPEVVLLFPLKTGKKWGTTGCTAVGEELTSLMNAAMGTHKVAGKRYTKIESVIEGRKTVNVPAGSFDTWVVRTKKIESSGPAVLTWSYYAKDIGVVLEENVLKGTKRARTLELISIEKTKD